MTVKTPKARPADPCCFIIFGASGDLTHRLLVPALYNLGVTGLLPKTFALIGVARTASSSDAFRDGLKKGLTKFTTRPLDEHVVKELLSCVVYVQGDPDDDETYKKIGAELTRIEQERNTHGNRLFYLATPPAAFAPIGCHLGQSGLAHEEKGAWRRVVFEKPFGTDLATAQALNRRLLSILKEDQIFRIDHYLGKETVQNIMVLRFANAIFAPLWNRRYMDHIQITAAETLGVEGRAGYYEGAGALRDMVQNHLLQLLCLVTMEAPSDLSADSIRDEKVKVVRCLRRLSADEVASNVVRAQYAEGAINGQPVPAYRAEQNVNPKSMTDTFVALRLHIDDWRFWNVPIYMRVGKRLPKSAT